jgi:hypothetical protein
MILMKRTTRAATALLTLASVLVQDVAWAQNAVEAPAQKQIGAARSETVPSLIVLNSDGARLEGGTLTLTGVAQNAVIFADRPVRSAGHALTSHLIEEWAEGSDSFAKDPPNATVSVFSKAADDVEDAVVVLKSPKLDGTTLTFQVDVLEGSIAKDGPASVFIDIIGLPFTPLSYAGVARRTARRAAWYGAAAGAAAAYGYPYYHPYAYPYGYPPPPPRCGYYPLPPCY